MMNIIDIAIFLTGDVTRTTIPVPIVFYIAIGGLIAVPVVAVTIVIIRKVRDELKRNEYKLEKTRQQQERNRQLAEQGDGGDKP